MWVEVRCWHKARLQLRSKGYAGMAQIFFFGGKLHDGDRFETGRVPAGYGR